jgi:hypothetical protein
VILVLRKGATRKEMNSIYKKLGNSVGVNTKKYCGMIKLNEEPLTIQKRMRNECQ